LLDLVNPVSMMRYFGPGRRYVGLERCFGHATHIGFIQPNATAGRGITFLIYALSREWHSELALLKKRLRRPWSPEDDRQLLDLVENEGKSRHLAAAALGRSKSAVANRLRVLRASTPVRKECVLDQ
jgi:hypothetical protein